MFHATSSCNTWACQPTSCLKMSRQIVRQWRHATGAAAGLKHCQAASSLCSEGANQPSKDWQSEIERLGDRETHGETRREGEGGTPKTCKEAKLLEGIP